MRHDQPPPPFAPPPTHPVRRSGSCSPSSDTTSLFAPLKRPNYRDSTAACSCLARCATCRPATSQFRWKKKTAGMNDKSLLVVVLAELQPRGSSHSRRASWLLAEELQAGEQNIRPCIRLLSLPPYHQQIRISQKKKLKI